MRARVYIDGFNFYYSIRNASKRGEFEIGLGWCDFRKLATSYLIAKHSDATVDLIKYFTAPVGPNAIRPREEERQNTWLRAVSTIPNLRIIEGIHQQHDIKPREEKQTDINIAVELLIDAVHRDCDRAILITGDIDQAPAVKAVRQRLPTWARIEVDVWIPPGLSHGRWKREGREHGFSVSQITPPMLAASRLPDEIKTPSGVIECLKAWRVQGAR